MATTKLLLIKDVDHLGRSGDIVKVKSGFARNFLLPKKVGMPATASTLRLQASLQEKRREQAVQDKKDSEQLALKLQGVSLATTVKVDHEGHMYGSVSAADVCQLLNEQLGIELDKKSIQLKTIKKIGSHQVKIQLKEGVTAEIEVTVAPEESEVTSKE